MLTEYQWSNFWQALCSTGKWVKWKPTEQDEKDWRAELEEYDVFLLDKARRKHSTDHGRYLQPVLGEFVLTIKAIAGYKGSSGSARVPVYWLCQAVDDKGFGQIGQIVEYSYSLNQLADLEQGHEMDGYLRGIYGGRWISMRTPLPQVFKKRRELLHEAKLCDKDTCLLCNPDRVARLDKIKSRTALTAHLAATGGIGERIMAPAAATKQEELSQKKKLVADLIEKHPQQFNPNKLYEETPRDNIPY